MDAQVQVIQLSGILEATNGNKLRSDVVSAIAAGKRTILLDYQDVTFMDSNGFGALVTSLKRVREVGGRLFLCGISDQVRMILELTGTHQVFDVFSDQESFKQEVLAAAGLDSAS